MLNKMDYLKSLWSMMQKKVSIRTFFPLTNEKLLNNTTGTLFASKKHLMHNCHHHAIANKLLLNQ